MNLRSKIYYRSVQCDAYFDKSKLYSLISYFCFFSNLILNKWPVKDGHIIASTKSIVVQNESLTIYDFRVIREILMDRDYVGFFNCGPESGNFFQILKIGCFCLFRMRLSSK
jgi:ATP adenylyltransferase/5',5'''-P-1,P-4-tetraphosphate phosphorylase II